MNSKNDKKIFMKFIIMMLISGVVGGIVGFNAFRHFSELDGIYNTVSAWLISNSHFLFIINFALTIASLLAYLKGKKQAVKALASGEETDFENAEKSYSFSLISNNISVVLLFTFFSLSSLTISQGAGAISNVFISTVCFLSIFAATVALQNLNVKGAKMLAPEKNGNIFDTKFNKDWYDSCDEAEKQLIGKAAYKAFTVVSSCFPFAFLICIVLGVVIDIGILPQILIGGLWLILSMTYSIESAKYPKAKK